MDTKTTGDYVIVSINGKTKIWPKEEYLDYKAQCYGFEDYEDLKAHGYSID